MAATRAPSRWRTAAFLAFVILTAPLVMAWSGLRRALAWWWDAITNPDDNTI